MVAIGTMNQFILRSLLATLLVVFNLGAAINGLEQAPLSTSLFIRNATTSDAADITNVILSAFRDAAHWKYAYQFKDQHPEEHFNCFHESLREALKIPDVLAQVVLLPNITRPHELEPIAVALWILPTAWQTDIVAASAFLLFSTAMLAKCEHRDMNLTRVDDYDHQFFVAKEQYLDNVYAKQNQLYLDTLATHPDYQRRGAGSALVRSGLAIGKAAYNDDNITATLIATEAGEPLYQYLGWDSMCNFSVHSLETTNGSREHWRFDVMKHEL